MQSRWILLMALTAVMLYLCWKILAPFMSILLWAAVLVLVFYPANDSLRRRTGRPALAAMVSTAMVVAVIVLPMAAVTSAVVAELKVTSVHVQTHITELLHDPRLPALIDRVYQITGTNEDELRRAIQQGANQAGESLVQGTVSVLGTAMSFLVNLGFVCFTMFYLFLDGHKFVATLRDWLPLDDDEAHSLLVRCGDIISASVYGVVVLAVIQGCLGGVMFWWLGLPSPMLWGLVMILLATIPMLGTFVVWVPAAIYLAVTGHFVKALVLTVWGSVVIGMSDNLLRPRLVGHKTKMHDLMIFFAVLGGLQAFGVLGILMGPVVLAVAMTLLETFRRGERVPDVVVVEAETPAPVLLPPAPPEPEPEPEPAPAPPPEGE